jgi:hypothetical protein
MKLCQRRKDVYCKSVDEGRMAMKTLSTKTMNTRFCPRRVDEKSLSWQSQVNSRAYLRGIDCM